MSDLPNSTQKNDIEFIFGGTFDPIHLGHLAIIQTISQLAPKIPIRLLPCAIPALKSAPSTTFAQRLEMVQMATAEMPNIIIDTREQKRSSPSYTLETLQSLHTEFPLRTFVLVMGMDSLQDLPDWFGWQQLSDLCHLLVINRPQTDFLSCKAHLSTAGFKLAEQFELLTKSSNGLSFSCKMPEKPHSSTKIRDLIANNQELDSMLPQSVIEYVRQFHLYKSEPI